MMPAELDAAATVVLSWLLTYAIHSTILLTLAAVVAWRLNDEHAWLDLIWRTALIAPLVTATLHLAPITLPLGRPLTMPSVTVAETPARPSMTAERVTSSPVVDRSAEIDKGAATAKDRSAWFQSIVRLWPSIAGVSWLSIAIITVVRYGLRLRRAYRALESGVSVTSIDLVDTVDDLCRRANQRRPILLTTSPFCQVPLALATGHILLPDRFLKELDSEQQRAALAHEVAHIARRDPEWRIAVEILERVLFFQPLNRLARVRLCEAAEFLCDEWAVRQAGSPLAMARCLSAVASWRSQADELPAGVSAMARSDSAMVRRVTRILNEPAHVARPRLGWLAVPVALVAIAAPRVTAKQLPASVAARPTVALASTAAIVEKAAEQRIHRSARPGDPLEERWRQALADAARQSLAEFWIVYTFNTPTHANDVMMSDTRDGSFVSSNGQISTRGRPLTALSGPSAVPLEGGTVAVLLHYRGTRAGDRLVPVVA
jgi:beta-lactamase regulating signal transducer with metallopeptidase domain